MLTNDALMHTAWLEISKQLKSEVDEKKTRSEILQSHLEAYDLVSGEYAAVKPEVKEKEAK